MIEPAQVVNSPMRPTECVTGCRGRGRSHVAHYAALTPVGAVYSAEP